jgi:hypothetical protein
MDFRQEHPGRTTPNRKPRRFERPNQGGKAGLGIIEKTLVAQANSLDAIFNELVCRAALNMGEYLETIDRYMRLALKAQRQCRAMLKCLAEIKSPAPLVFVKQANIADNQQVNNVGE